MTGLHTGRSCLKLKEHPSILCKKVARLRTWPRLLLNAQGALGALLDSMRSIQGSWASCFDSDLEWARRTGGLATPQFCEDPHKAVDCILTQPKAWKAWCKQLLRRAREALEDAQRTATWVRDFRAVAGVIGLTVRLFKEDSGLSGLSCG